VTSSWASSQQHQNAAATGFLCVECFAYSCKGMTDSSSDSGKELRGENPMRVAKHLKHSGCCL